MYLLRTQRLKPWGTPWGKVMSILTCKEIFGFVSLFLPVLGISGYGRSNEEKKK